MVKLWRESNDGLYWAQKGCKLEKEQFGIVRIQVAGKIISLYFSRSIFHEIFLNNTEFYRVKDTFKCYYKRRG